MQKARGNRVCEETPDIMARDTFTANSSCLCVACLPSRYSVWAVQGKNVYLGRDKIQHFPSVYMTFHVGTI